MKNYRYISLIIFLLLGLLGSCKDEEPNLCLDKVPTSAYFEAHEDFGIVYPEAWIPYDTDTMWTRHATFVAQEEEAYYTWIIGAETIEGYDKRSVTRNHFPRGQTIPITLIVQKEPDLACFPQDDGIDTLVRNIRFLEERGSWADNTLSAKGIGVFRGSLTNNPEEVFEIEISTYIAESASWKLLVSNVKDGEGFTGNFIFDGGEYLGYKQTLAYGGVGSREDGFHHLRKGLLRVYDNDSVRFDYDMEIYLSSESETKSYTFLGKKIRLLVDFGLMVSIL